jgi:hypothetical protein
MVVLLWPVFHNGRINISPISTYIIYFKPSLIEKNNKLYIGR